MTCFVFFFRNSLKNDCFVLWFECKLISYTVEYTTQFLMSLENKKISQYFMQDNMQDNMLVESVSIL